MQKKKVYMLEQQIYTITKENTSLKTKNKQLYDVVNQSGYRSTHEVKAKPKKKPSTKVSWWKRLAEFFKKKKNVPQRAPNVNIVSTGVNGMLKEDIHMLRRSSDGMKKSQSSSSLPILNNTSIQKRVNKRNSN